MRAFTYFLLSFIGVAHGLPVLLAEHKRDQLINLSPNLDLGLGVDNDNSCLGLGISVCDPITVDSKKNDTVVHDTGSKAKAEPSTNDSGSGDSLINLSPDVDLGLDLSNENSCLGIGISACDPITVGSDVTKTVKDGGDEAKVEPSSTASTTATPAPATYPVQSSPPSSTSASSSSPTSSPTTNSGGNSLLDLSPKIAPDLNLSNDNSCQGIGISACDPITVDSIVKNISS
ncbi:hypothetical protein F5Y00DRAFT_235465 [Daldinia vernicosa]|uniref:uncharacterized protein n=1 Tax=Daldinia vernicosa TaxID=114800 RepID=UPI00200726E3|nr:uncharacterized protein F5Y00DRAFT_235465 [Daldinia vernicosa]KAI0849671.1 hypothetical protein F5Y00DRAFT_235465 [Daldinia vernicosa]